MGVYLVRCRAGSDACPMLLAATGLDHEVFDDHGEADRARKMADVRCQFAPHEIVEYQPVRTGFEAKLREAVKDERRRVREALTALSEPARSEALAAVFRGAVNERR